MDDERIEHALRQGPPDEPGYVPGVARTLAEADAGAPRDGATGPAAFEGRVARGGADARRDRDGATSRAGTGRPGWALPLAAVVTFAVVGLAIQVNLPPGASPSPRYADLLARITAERVVRIAVSNEAPQIPTTGGASAGFDVDVARALAEQLGVRAEVQLVPPGTIVLGEGNWELALPSALLPVSLDGAVAGPAYYNWPAWIVVESDSSVTSIDDLNRARICVVAGSPGAAWHARRPARDLAISLLMPVNTTAVNRPNDEACLSALADGEADAAVTSTLLDSDFASRSLRAVGVPFITHWRIVLIRDSADLGDPTSLLAAVNAAIDDLHATGVLGDLSRRAFGGQDLTGAIP
jgi:ABC-type amino acid transport substrate-binding protein